MNATTDQQDSSDSALKEMGIKNPHEITRYSVHQVEHHDELRVFYKRKKGSFLPTTRKYTFGRAGKMVVADSGTGQLSETFEISPFLQKAIAELDAILEESEQKEITKNDILKEIKYLEDTTCNRLRDLKELVDKL